MSTLTQRKLARILFDEFHSESWSISRERAREMQPEDPANASYQHAADELARRDFQVVRNINAALNPESLRRADVLVFLHPCDPKWEHTTSRHSPALSAEEIESVLDWVRGGGGLLVITEYEHDKYADNLNDLIAPAGLRIENGRIFDRTSCAHENPEWIIAEPVPDSPLAHRASRACFYRAGWCHAQGEAAIAWRATAQAHPARAGVVATAPLGAGRIAVANDSVLFGDERFDAYDHRQLWLNLAYWLAAPAFQRARLAVSDSSLSDGAPWRGLKAATNELRLLQQPDGSIAAEAGETAVPLVARMKSAITDLRPHFPHQESYLDQLVLDLTAWEKAGFARPDFAASLAAFCPQRHRRDGLENLVVFPIYTPNASSDTRFEALIMRTPWPGWLARLEESTFSNKKFVPGHFVDFTEGYASECAVLFPETVSLRDRPTNQFGVIFCDREARRLQNCVQRAASAVSLALHPELECWLGALPLIQDTVALWDLIHDRAHSLGELPFDPFMIRQRAPFWMYGLEELRVDLRSFGEAARLAESEFPFARYVCYAILLDRIFRFPITGPRVRNYDALGGQLLFAYLHQKDVLLWRDNRLTICWEALESGVAGLREELTTLYKLGADCSKMSFWLAAHDLVARYVRPNVASKWKADSRAIADEVDPQKWIALVHEDEFPLGIFHLNLQRKLR
jgi:hypothetical protein